MELYIDTTDNRRSVVKIGDLEMVKEYESPRGQDILKLIEETLAKAKVEKSEISAIKVNPGPGAFTSTRVGVAVANALALSLKISVNGLKTGEFVKPIYEKEPSITLSDRQ